jgi:hypothetical protein
LTNSNFNFNFNFVLYLQIEVQAIRGNNELGYIALDFFEFRAIDHCDFQPEAAIPTTTSSTPTPPTTPIPTEPPNGD